MMARVVIWALILWIVFTVRAVRADIDTGDMTIEQGCRELRLLHAKYRGASLSLAEKAIKAQLVAWYRANCPRRRR